MLQPGSKFCQHITGVGDQETAPSLVGHQFVFFFLVLFCSCVIVANCNPSTTKVRSHSRDSENREWNSMTLSALRLMASEKDTDTWELSSSGLPQSCESVCGVGISHPPHWKA